MSYADDKTTYCSYDSFEDIISCLEKTADDLFKWFTNNGMKANAHNPFGIYMFKVNNRNTRTRCEIYSKLTIKTPEQR